MAVDAAIIGGTGVGELLAARGGSLLRVPTRLGWLSGRRFDHEDVSILAIQRHSAGHKRPPHAVNYGAIALGLRRLDVKACLATAAVGSLRADWPAGTLAVCTDFVDLSGRNTTLFDSSVVHTDCGSLADRAVREAVRSGAESIASAVYVQTNGPRYETPREIELMSQFGDVIGMTAASEAIAMKEAGVPYGCLAVVTNLAAGIGECPLSHEDVVRQMRATGERALDILLRAATSMAKVAA